MSTTDNKDMETKVVERVEQLHGIPDGIDKIKEMYEVTMRPDSVQDMVRILGPIMADIQGKETSKVPDFETTIHIPEADANESHRGSISSNIPHLEESLNTGHFQQLMAIFSEYVPEEIIEKPKSRLPTRHSQKSVKPERKAGLLRLSEFQTILSKLLKVPEDSTDAYQLFKKQSEMLFKKVDRNHCKEISWDAFCCYIMLKCQEKDHIKQEKTLPMNNQPKVVRMHNIKETIAKVVHDINPKKFIVISKEGVLNVLRSNLEIFRTFEVESHGEEEKLMTKRRTKLWVTDAVLMPNVSKLVISSTNRDLTFYDLSTPVYKSQFVLCAIPNIPMCMCYTFDKLNKASKSRLVFGTDNGDIHLMTFSTPTKGLFETPFKRSDSCWQIFFNDLTLHNKRVSQFCLPNVHSDWIRRIRYIAETETLISCSSNGRDSLILRNIDESKKKSYLFRVSKGIDCFDFSKSKNIIVTGSVDHIVRIWDPYVTQRPIALLRGHQTVVRDVLIHEKHEKIFSYSSDGDLRAWDIKEQTCLQRILIKLPVGNIDNGPSPIFKALNTRILLVVDNCLADIRTNNSQSLLKGNVTHDGPLCGAIYNPQLDQVITGSEGSDISIWEVETGQLVATMNNIHKREELSCLALDKTFQRLITATRDGSAAIWNVSTGLIECKLESYDESEITNVVNISDRNLISFVGWSRRILMYSDLQQDGTIPYERSWVAEEAHEDDILTVAYHPPNVVATGSFDGEIKLWSLDREKLIRVLRKKLSRPLPPVDKLLFLSMKSHHSDAFLVSSSAGMIEFWPLYSTNVPFQPFLASTAQDASVVAMCISLDESLLVTGDTGGWISTWNIGKFSVNSGKSDIRRAVDNSTFVTALSTPMKGITFEAHTKAVVTVALAERISEMLIISASSDNTAKLFTLSGELIGQFGQKKSWHLSRPKIKRVTTRGKTRSSNHDKEHSEDLDTNGTFHSQKDNKGVTKMEPETERPFTTSSLPAIGKVFANNRQDSITRDLQALMKSDYYRSRTVILDSTNKKKENWSFLGSNYNDNAERRMNDRRHRRENLVWLETHSNGYCRTGNPFSPFNALQTSEARDPVLPRDLPVSTRMLRKGFDLSQPETLEHMTFLKEKDGHNIAPLL